MQTVVLRIGQRFVLAVIGETRIRPASVIGSGRDTSGHILVDGNDQMHAAHMLIANAQGGPFAELLLDFHAALVRVGVLHVRVHGGKVHQHAGR